MRQIHDFDHSEINESIPRPLHQRPTTGNSHRNRKYLNCCKSPYSGRHKLYSCGVICADVTADEMLEGDKRFSEFLGGRRRRFSEFLGGRKRFSEFLGGRKRFSEFLGGKKRFSEFLGGKRNDALSLSDGRFT